MICHHCGKEIGNHINFCGYCGAKQTDSPGHSQKKMGIIVKILYVISCVFLLAAIVLGVSYFIKPIAVETTDHLDFVSNNLQNGGYVTGDDRNAYFISKEGVRKLSLEDGTIESVTERQTPHFAFEWIYSYNGFLFYEDAFSANWLDGNEMKTILSGSDHAYLNCIFLESPDFYYTAVNRVDCWIEQYYNGTASKLQNLAVSEMYRYGDYLYVISKEKDREDCENPYYGVWRICIDGSQMERILDFCPDAFLMWGDTAYYAYDNELFIRTPNSTEWNVIPNIEIRKGYEASFNICGDQIYYIDRETGDIYRIRNNGKQKKLIAENVYSSIYIVGDWIFYDRAISSTEQSLCRVKNDGSENQIVVANWK